MRVKLRSLVHAFAALTLSSGVAADERQTVPTDTSQVEVKQLWESKSTEPTLPANDTYGTYDPGKGFLVARTSQGELAISAYGMLRYINQLPASQSYTDHLGNQHPVDARQDFWTHRIMIWLKGWMFNTKLIYTFTIWTVNTTDQDALFANVGYQFSRHFNLYGGIAGNGGSRSLLGSHPYWLAHDRVMADEFFRPYFGSAIYANGETVHGLWYHAMVGNSNSILGVKASQLDREPTVSGSLWWMPTTSEFGPRGAYGDYEMHESLATRFGVSSCFSPEQRYNETGDPQNTTLKLTDAANVFSTGALAPGVTVQNVDYTILSFDAGAKYKGWFLQGEYYTRWLDHFDADGALPVDEIVDTGFYVQAACYPVRQRLELYVATSQIYGDSDAGFGDASEYLIGANFYPFNTRDTRLNIQYIDVNHSPVGSTFGHYTAGQNGETVAVSYSLMF